MMQHVTDTDDKTLGDPTLVYCDLETSDLSANILLQIACNSKGRNFNIYCSPTGDLPHFCTQLTGLYCVNNKLYKNGRQLPTYPVEAALNKFSEFIESFKSPVTLVCFNNFGFDAKVLVKHFLKTNSILPKNLTHFADPLPAFKKLLKTEKVENFKLGTLCKHFEVSLIEAHDARYDSLSLQTLCEKVTNQRNISMITFLDKYIKPLDHFLQQTRNRK